MATYIPHNLSVVMNCDCVGLWTESTLSENIMAQFVLAGKSDGRQKYQQ